MARHAVIGAGGQIGRLLVEELRQRGTDVVAIERGRGPGSGEDGVERCRVDAGDVGSLTRALADCDVAYSVLGLPYRADVWEAQWPSLMAGVAEAARRAGCRLVYLDNLYGYGPVEGPITEDTPLRPVSRMGRARAVTAEQLLQGAGSTPVVIGRAADFVGPGAVASSAGEQVFGPVVRGTARVRRVPWLGDPRRLHSWAGTRTVAAALATLGDGADGSSGVWLLPVCRPVTGLDFCAALGRVAGCTVTPRSVPTWVVRLGGVVRPDLRAVAEGMYQLTSDQVVDDRRWRQRFPVEEPDFEDLLAEALRWFTDRRSTMGA